MLVKIFLILPALTLATRMELEIKGDFRDEQSNLVALLYGEDNSIATDKERRLFNLEDGTLKDGIRIIHGGRPDNVYVCSPTPWGDLYKTYGWDQVQRSLVPSHATLINVNSELETVTQQVFENNSTKPITVNVALTKDVHSTIASSWSKLAHMAVEDLQYKLSVDVNGVKMAMRHVFSWGKDGKGFKKETVGSTSELKLNLLPNQAVTAKLQAKKALISVKFDYEAILQGAVAANYENPYNGHHFYKFDVNDILVVKNLPDKAKATQIITFVFYYDAKVIVTDQKIGTKLFEKKITKTPTRSEDKDTESTKLKTSSKSGVTESPEHKNSEETIPEERKTRISLTIPKDADSTPNDISTGSDIPAAKLNDISAVSDNSTAF